MSQTDLSHYIPRRLDDAGKFLFWEMDVAAFPLLGLFIGVATGFALPSFIFGVVLAYQYNKLKSGKHPGMASHTLYWLCGTPTPKELPGSHLRELNG